ncbi:transposase [Thermanaerosceptrum fracticalcis]|uniref:Transposase n=1 Tax=Thermanaerosceptrum fracticalcis TaxID=1712410 RepID=A0A7G6E875_THEFR|nr:transposase [Thermanaerosceptrum fracticalcis]QNB48254.1 transposase [Thermanaerosceptrum fracticalcis]QNB48265.1 transposase [Thermanaerosceptrum fracticalcis]QNB48272.1 transposase [Thermanaerosceptrum fracticalcis]QNB48279.1 transposase [Thermanaerosceptrum fracticalcis]
MSQSAFSRFLSKPFQWLRFSLGRFARLQENTDSRLTDGDIIALDDTKIEHPHGKKIPFLCWLFDSSDKCHVWCINLVSTLAVLKNGLEYPMLWRFWVKNGQENEKQTKLDLAKQMLAEVRQLNKARLWVAMDRWFLCKKFLNWLMGQNFDWVTKAKRNTALFRKIYDPVLGKERYIKLNPKQLLREVYSQLRVLGKESVLSIPDIYIKMPYETLTRKGKPITRQRFLPIAAIAATYEKQAVEGSIVLPEEECPATFKDAYLLISNRVDTPEEAATAYAKRWRIEVFYRTAKQNLGLTSCYAQSETAHFAHVELLFTAKTLLCYASWECNKEGAEQAPSLCEVIRYFFNAGCRIRCCEQLIQVYFDTATQRFSRLIDKFWPHSLELRLWNWKNYPETA